jgi:hypothetical protein
MKPMEGEHLQKFNRWQKKQKRKKLTRHHNKAASLGGGYDT